MRSRMRLRSQTMSIATTFLDSALIVERKVGFCRPPWPLNWRATTSRWIFTAICKISSPPEPPPNRTQCFLPQNLTHRLHSALARAHDLIADWSAAYKLRAKRWLLLWRAFRKRKQLSMVENRTAGVGPNDILLFATIRNEQLRLPFFMAHYRRLGVQHFFFISNNSTDGTNDFLARQQDV